jgi:hypothetical protein
VSSITLLRITVNDSIRMGLCAIGILQTLARRVQSKCGSSPCRSGESPWRPRKIGALTILPTGVKAVLRTEDAVLSRTAEPANVVTVRMLARVFRGDRILAQSLFLNGIEGMVWLNHTDGQRVHAGNGTPYWPCARIVFTN